MTAMGNRRGAIGLGAITRALTNSPTHEFVTWFETV